MRTVSVHLGPRSYEICIGCGVVARIDDVLSRMGAGRPVIITDTNLAELHVERVQQHLRDPLVLVVPAGEASKSLDCAACLYDKLAEARIERSDAIIALGGGVVGDLAGFVAATWHRGMRFIQMPTTTEAALDASVGGKTALNLGAAKNLIGAFHQPAAVLVDCDFLMTLPERDARAGLAESVKHGALLSGELLKFHQQHADDLLDSPDLLTELVARNCTLKAAIVAEDERDFGRRAWLNYGHTVGHALEHKLRFQLRHGEAVALGMRVEDELAVRRGLLRRDEARQIAAALDACGLPARSPAPLDAAKVVERCLRDKKVTRGRLRLALLKGIERPVVVDDITPDEIATALEVIAPARP